MSDENSKLDREGRNLVDQVNEEWGRKLRDELPEGQPIQRFDHALITLRVKEIHSDKVVFRDLDEAREEINLDSIELALRNMPYEEHEHVEYALGELATPFLLRNNQLNPYRVERHFVKEEAPEGSVTYAFGQWIAIPFREEGMKIKKKQRGGDLLDIPSAPKHAVVATKLERGNIHGILNMLEDEHGYKMIHLRFGNQYPRLPYATLTLSLSGPNTFRYEAEQGDNSILDKWGPIVPGLRESYRIRTK